MWEKIRYLLTQTIKEWQEDKASRLAAALSYYTIFSLPPLLILGLAIAGQVFDRQAAQERLVSQAGQLVGQDGAEGIAMILENASEPGAGLVAGIISVVTLFLGASGAFAQLQDAMDTIWEVQPRPGRSVLGTIKDRLFSFTMVLTVGFLLLVSLLLSTVLAALGEFIGGLAPGFVMLAQIINFVVSFGVTVLLFALIFKVIPDVTIQWKDVWLGAFVTAALFAIGRWAIGLYLGQSATASTYGAAGSLIVLLVWVYYAAQIVFLGAEFTQVYTHKYGSQPVADEKAVPITEEARAEQGIPREGEVEERERDRERSPRQREGMDGQERQRVTTREVRTGTTPEFVLQFHQLLVNVLAAPVALWSAIRDTRAPVSSVGYDARLGLEDQGLSRVSEELTLNRDPITEIHPRRSP